MRFQLKRGGLDSSDKGRFLGRPCFRDQRRRRVFCSWLCAHLQHTQDYYRGPILRSLAIATNRILGFQSPPNAYSSHQEEFRTVVFSTEHLQFIQIHNSPALTKSLFIKLTYVILNVDSPPAAAFAFQPLMNIGSYKTLAYVIGSFVVGCRSLPYSKPKPITPKSITPNVM